MIRGVSSHVVEVVVMQEELPFVELFLASDDTSKEGQRVRKFVRQVLRKLNVRLPSCVVRSSNASLCAGSQRDGKSRKVAIISIDWLTNLHPKMSDSSLTGHLYLTPAPSFASPSDSMISIEACELRLYYAASGAPHRRL